MVTCEYVIVLTGCVPGYSNVQITPRRVMPRRKCSTTTSPLSCHRSTAPVGDDVREWRGPTIAQDFRCILVIPSCATMNLQTWSCDHPCCKTFIRTTRMMYLEVPCLVMWLRCSILGLQSIHNESNLSQGADEGALQTWYQSHRWP